MKIQYCVLSLVLVITLTSCASINRINRVDNIHQVTLSTLQYADKHNGILPTTEGLAVFCNANPLDFQYVVVLTGKIEQHNKRGGWPKVLIAEKNGGAYGEWSFGFVDVFNNAPPEIQGHGQC